MRISIFLVFILMLMTGCGDDDQLPLNDSQIKNCLLNKKMSDVSFDQSCKNRVVSLVALVIGVEVGHPRRIQFSLEPAKRASWVHNGVFTFDFLGDGLDARQVWVSQDGSLKAMLDVERIRLTGSISGRQLSTPVVQISDWSVYEPTDAERKADELAAAEAEERKQAAMRKIQEERETIKMADEKVLRQLLSTCKSRVSEWAEKHTDNGTSLLIDKYAPDSLQMAASSSALTEDDERIKNARERGKLSTSYSVLTMDEGWKGFQRVVTNLFCPVRINDGKITVGAVSRAY